MNLKPLSLGQRATAGESSERSTETRQLLERERETGAEQLVVVSGAGAS